MKIAVTICDEFGNEIPDLVPVDDICSDATARLAAARSGTGCGGKCGGKTLPARPDPSKAVGLVLELVARQVLPPADGTVILAAIIR